MAIAIILLLLVIGSVAFHLVTPWWLTELASNWRAMDDTLAITVAVTGLFFVVINLFVVYSLWRFRHREGQRAAYQPEDRRLERWLIGITTVGIVALLAPGLVVYARFVDPPADAMELEIVGQQWKWRYRFAGADGKLGASDVRFITGDNPLGVDPDDGAGHDDVVVLDGAVHLPMDRPVKVLLRSHDVLHDFFVPQFRARMNIVPGQVSWFWFTPTRAGTYEAMCAQLCGVGHPSMKGEVVVEPAAAFEDWLGRQTTFTASRLPPAGDVHAGQQLAQSKGCLACHTLDGQPGVGPTWRGLFGKTETLADGSTALVDEDFIRGFIRDPKARNIRGFPPVMPQIDLSEAELETLVDYIKTLDASAPR